jgi:DNA-binding NarL/FixJ family response regulator
VDNPYTYKIDIALVDDDVHILHDISLLLNEFNCFGVTGAYKNCDEALKMIVRNAPHILLLDLNLKEGNGIACIPALLSASPLLKIIIYSNYYSPEKAVDAKKAGAKGYIVKNVQIDSLYAAILSVYEGREVWPEELTHEALRASEKKYPALLKFLKMFVKR